MEDEQKPLLQREDYEDGAGTGNYWGGCLNLLATMIGAGAMALPYTLNKSGWALALGMLVVSCWATYISIIALNHCATLSKGKTYVDVVEAFCGTWGRAIAEVMMLILMFGSLCMFLLISVDLLTPFMPVWMEKGELRVIIAILMTLLSLPRTLQGLSSLSFLIVAFIIFILATIIYQIVRHTEEGWKAFLNIRDYPAFRMDSDCGMSLNVQLLAFSSHVNIPRTQYELPPRQRPHMVSMIRIVMLIGLLFYATFAVVGLVYTKGQPHDDILTDLGNDYILRSCKGIFALLLILKAPLLFQPFREILEELWNRCYHKKSLEADGYHEIPLRQTGVIIATNVTYGVDADNHARPLNGIHSPPHQEETICTQILYYLETFILGGLVYIGTIFIPNLSSIMSLLGSTGGVATNFIIVAWMLYKSCSFEWRHATQDHGARFLGRCSALFLLLFGLVMSAIGFIAVSQSREKVSS